MLSGTLGLGFKPAFLQHVCCYCRLALWPFGLSVIVSIVCNDSHTWDWHRLTSLTSISEFYPVPTSSATTFLPGEAAVNQHGYLQPTEGSGTELYSAPIAHFSLPAVSNNTGPTHTTQHSATKQEYFCHHEGCDRKIRGISRRDNLTAHLRAVHGDTIPRKRKYNGRFQPAGIVKKRGNRN